jgi:hypothetical protein
MSVVDSASRARRKVPVAVTAMGLLAVWGALLVTAPRSSPRHTCRPARTSDRWRCSYTWRQWSSVSARY